MESTDTHACTHRRTKTIGPAKASRRRRLAAPSWGKSGFEDRVRARAPSGTAFPRSPRLARAGPGVSGRSREKKKKKFLRGQESDDPPGRGRPSPRRGEGRGVPGPGPEIVGKMAESTMQKATHVFTARRKLLGSRGSRFSRRVPRTYMHYNTTDRHDEGFCVRLPFRTDYEFRASGLVARRRSAASGRPSVGN